MKIKLLKESDNTTMKKDVNGVVPIVYADAVNQADEKKKIIADRLKDKKPELKKPFTGTTKQPLPKKEEQTKSELSEALFEDYEDESLTESPTATLEKPKKVKDIEELPDDVYTLVYDRLFPGNRKYRPLLAQGLPKMYDEEKFYTKGLGDSDIGVSVKDEADAELAKTVAKELKLKYELKKSNYLRGGNQYIAIIHIPDDISEMTVADYYKKIGKSTDRDDVRMSPSLWSKLRKKAVGESKETSDEAKELTEDAKIIQDLSDFKPWSGAEETLERIKDEDKFDDLDRLIEELYPDGIDETDLNDLLRFESDWVYEQLGIEDEEAGEDNED